MSLEEEEIEIDEREFEQEFEQLSVSLNYGTQKQSSCSTQALYIIAAIVTLIVCVAVAVVVIPFGFLSEATNTSSTNRHFTVHPCPPTDLPQGNRFADVFPQLASRGFCSPSCYVRAGETITFHLASNQYAAVAGAGAGGGGSASIEGYPEAAISDGLCFNRVTSACSLEGGCSWAPTLSFHTPTTMKSGFYALRWSGGANVHFVVGCTASASSAREDRLLHIVNWLTGGSAYSAYGGGSIYGGFTGNTLLNQQARTVSLRLPVARFQAYGDYPATPLEIERERLPRAADPWDWPAGLGPLLEDHVEPEICYVTLERLPYEETIFNFSRAVLLGKQEYATSASFATLKRWIGGGRKLFIDAFEFGWDTEFQSETDPTSITYGPCGPVDNPLAAWSSYCQRDVLGSGTWADWLPMWQIGGQQAPEVTSVQMQVVNRSHPYASWVPETHYLSDITYAQAAQIEQRDSDGRWCFITPPIDCESASIWAVSQRIHKNTSHIDFPWRVFYATVRVGSGEFSLWGGTIKGVLGANVNLVKKWVSMHFS